MTKRELINYLEASPVPDEDKIQIDVSWYDDEDEVKGPAPIERITNWKDEQLWLVAEDVRMR